MRLLCGVLSCTPYNARPGLIVNVMQDIFRRFAQWTSHLVGTAWSFLIAAGIVLVWALSGPLFGFSNTWQLVINTGTTIVTFLMVFLIQNTQNRDATALHLKLDELLRGVKGARTGLVGLEELSDDELKELHDDFERLAKNRGIRTNGGRPERLANGRVARRGADQATR